MKKKKNKNCSYSHAKCLFLLFFFYIIFIFLVHTFVNLSLIYTLQWIVKRYYGSHCRNILTFCSSLRSFSLRRTLHLQKDKIQIYCKNKKKIENKNVLITLLPILLSRYVFFFFAIDINVDCKITIIMANNSSNESKKKKENIKILGKFRMNEHGFTVEIYRTSHILKQIHRHTCIRIHCKYRNILDLCYKLHIKCYK